MKKYKKHKRLSSRGNGNAGRAKLRVKSIQDKCRVNETGLKVFLKNYKMKTEHAQTFYFHQKAPYSSFMQLVFEQNGLDRKSKRQRRIAENIIYRSKIEN